jgi:hypothetical protein
LEAETVFAVGMKIKSPSYSVPAVGIVVPELVILSAIKLQLRLIGFKSAAEEAQIATLIRAHTNKVKIFFIILNILVIY